MTKHPRSAGLILAATVVAAISVAAVAVSSGGPNGPVAAAVAADWSAPQVVSATGASPAATSLGGDALGVTWWERDRVHVATVGPGAPPAAAPAFAAGSAPGLSVAPLGDGRLVVGSGGRTSRLSVVDRRGRVVRSVAVDGDAPSVGALPGGHALAVWTAEPGDGHRTAIIAQVFDPSGRALPPHTVARGRLGSDAVSSVSDPVVAVGEGGSAVVWREVPGGSGKPVLRLSVLTAIGTPSPPFTVSRPGEVLSPDGTGPSISVGASGAVAVSWSIVPAGGAGAAPRQRVMRWLSAGGQLGPVTALADATTIADDAVGAAVEALDDGGALAVLDDGSSVRAEPVSADGTVGAARTLFSGRAVGLSVASNGSTTIAAWQRITNPGTSSAVSSILGVTIDQTTPGPTRTIAPGGRGEADSFANPTAVIDADGGAAVAFAAGLSQDRGIRVAFRRR